MLPAPETPPDWTSAKSVESTPVTLLVKVTVQLTLVAFVGDDPARSIDWTYGVASYVTVLSVLVEAVFELPALSVALAAAIVATTVPLTVMPLTATSYVVPDP